MERLFQILAVILAGVAAVFFLGGKWDPAVISAGLGAVGFLLSVGVQSNERVDAREAERQRAEELAAEEEEETRNDER